MVILFISITFAKKMQTAERIDAISLMRVMAMTMIVLFHSFLFYTGTWWVFGGTVIPIWVKVARFLDSIDLSMFVYISGFLYGYLYLYQGKYNDTKIFLQNKVRRLLIPYLFWGIIVAALPPSPCDWKTLFVGSAHLWFLLMLFWLFAFSALWKKVLNLKDTNFFLLILFLLYSIWLIYHRFSSHHSFLCFESALSYSLVFLIGMVSAKKQIWKRASRASIFLSLLMILALFFYVFFMSSCSDTMDNLILRVLSYTFIANFFIVLSKLKLSSDVRNIVEKIDKLSMGVYIFNQFVINALLLVPSINYWLEQNYKIGPLVIFVISFFIPLCLSYIFNKYKCLSWTIGG